MILPFCIIVAPLDEGDYSPVDDDNTAAHNTEAPNSLIGKVQKTAEKFNNLINNQKLSKGSLGCDKEMISKRLETAVSTNPTNLDVQGGGKNLKELINGSGIDNTVDSGIGQLSSNSLSGTSVSGSISSSNSCSTSPQDSHNDSGYSTRVGYSAGPSPSLSGTLNCSYSSSHSIAYKA